jgi:MSHA biogenesis protein MshO
MSSVRFAMERLRREVANALPNSIIAENDCLTFSPIIDYSIYADDFPIFPRISNSGFISPINKDLRGTKAVIGLLTVNELSNGSGNVQVVKSYDPNLGELIFFKPINFPSSSPTQRVYFIQHQTTYCFKNMNLYRRIDSGENVLMAEHVTGRFIPVASQSSLVQVSFNIEFDGEDVSVEQILHINNRL